MPTKNLHSSIPLNRRAFLRRSALAAGIFSVAPFNILHAANKGERIRCAVIGCGTRGMMHFDAVKKEKLVAFVDVDEARHATTLATLKDKEIDVTGLKKFTDYRRMFDKLGRQLDAVFIATPNHHHALPATLALRSGIAVYLEKPLCHTISEARALRALAASSKVATQMGNQGHCEDGYRRLCEYIWSGAIGAVTETHSWTDRANGGIGPRPPKARVPAGMHWNEWIGPAPFRDFHDDLHPHEWHGWHDFGNGSLGNLGCHVLDGVFWALKIEHPESVVLEQSRGGSDERFPMGAHLRWDVPARGEMPPVKVHWYEGQNPGAKGDATGRNRSATGADRYFPPMVQDLMKQFPDEELDAGSGTLYIGEKGVMFTGTYGEKMHILPWEKMRQTPAPAKSLPRPRAIFTDFLEAVRAGSKETAASFEYGARLTEFVLTGNLAVFAGVGNRLQWDGANMRVTNLSELNQRLKLVPRKGWQA